MMATDIKLLDELIDEETTTEVVKLKEYDEPVTKLAQMLENHADKKVYKTLIEGVTATPIPLVPLACMIAYLAPSKAAAQNMLEMHPRNALLTALELENNNTTIAKVFPENKQLQRLIFFEDVAKTKTETAKNEPDIHQYVDASITAALAAQMIMDTVPMVTTQATRINSRDDLKCIVLYDELVNSAKDKETKRGLKELARGRNLSANELLDASIEKLSSHEYPLYIKHHDMLRKGNIDRELTDKIMDELLGQSATVYERAVCFSEIIDNVSTLPKIYPQKEIIQAFENDVQDLVRKRPNLSKVLRGIIATFYRKNSPESGGKYLVRPLHQVDINQVLKEKLTVRDKNQRKGYLVACDRCGFHAHWEDGTIDQDLYTALKKSEFTVEFTARGLEGYTKELPTAPRLKLEAYQRLCDEFALDLSEEETNKFLAIKDSIEAKIGNLSQIGRLDFIKQRLQEVYSR